MNLQHVVDLTQKLHPVSLFRNLKTDFLQVFLDAEPSAIVQFLPQLAAVVCGDTQFFIDYDARDSLLLTGALYLSFLLIQQETQFL